MPPAANRTRLKFFITPVDLGLIDRAAAMTGETRADFILDAALRAAEKALPDQTRFVVSPDALGALELRLSAPPAPNDRLLRMMNTPAPWQ